MVKANKIVMTIAGLVLIIASILKSHQLLTEPIMSKGFWESWLFFVIQIPLELGLGIWLVSWLFRKASWLLTLLAFGVFIGITLHKGLTGEASCGCFGRVHVNPWITLSLIDVPIFILLLIFRPKGEKLLPPPWPTAKHFFGVAIPTFILLPSLLMVLIFNKPPEKTERYEVVRPQAVEKTADERPQWPLLEHIDIADSLRSGIVVVLLYHYDCPGCGEAIPMYDRMSGEMAGSGIRFAFIEIPPYGQSQNNPVPPATACLTGKLDTSKEWYIITPLVVLLQNGSIVKSWEAQAPALDEIMKAAFSDSK